MANISNSTANTLVTGTSSADSIYNTGGNVTINSGSGNDTINNQSQDHTKRVTLKAVLVTIISTILGPTIIM